MEITKYTKLSCFLLKINTHSSIVQQRHSAEKKNQIGYTEKMATRYYLKDMLCICALTHILLHLYSHRF
jgi:hypothetical protein